MSEGPLCPNLTIKFQKEVSQIVNRNLPIAMLLGGLNVNLSHLKMIINVLLHSGKNVLALFLEKIQFTPKVFVC